MSIGRQIHTVSLRWLYSVHENLMRDEDGVIRVARGNSPSSLCTGPKCHRLTAGTHSLQDLVFGLLCYIRAWGIDARQRYLGGPIPALAFLESNLTDLPLCERSGLMAHRPPNIRLDNQSDEVTEADDVTSDTQGETGPLNGAGEDLTVNKPLLFHKVKNRKSILAIVISDSKIFAGTQGGEILVWLWV